MPTSNINITPAWTKLADSSNAELLVTWSFQSAVEFAATAADAAPSIILEGHIIPPESAVTRGVLGAGYVWARTPDDQFATSKLVVTK